MGDYRRRSSRGRLSGGPTGMDLTLRSGITAVETAVECRQGGDARHRAAASLLSVQAIAEFEPSQST